MGLCHTILLIAGLVAAVPHTHAQMPVTSWTAFQRRDGLAHDWVTAVAETPEGAIWFATMGGGISRYDGRSWRTFSEADGLPTQAIGSLYVADDGILWASTQGRLGRDGSQFILRYDGTRWEAIALPEDLAEAGVRQIVGVGEGALCFATANGGILHDDGDSWKAITTDEGLSSNSVVCMLRARDGRGRPGRSRSGPRVGSMSATDPATGAWSPFADRADLPGMSVVAMAQAADGAIWLGTLNGGVARLDKDDWRVFTAEDGLPSGRVHVVSCGADGTVWVGTNAGAARYRPTDGGAEGTWRAFTESDGLPNNFVTSILTSADGSVWVGTVGGAARLNQTGWVHHEEWPGGRDRGGIALAADRDGRLWAATGEGLYRLEGTGWRTVARFERIAGPLVDLVADVSGGVWAATRGRVVRYRDGALERVELPGSGSHGRIRAICPSIRDGVWLGVDDGVLRFDGQAWDKVDLGDVEAVTAVCEVGTSDVLFGLSEGLVRVRDGELTRFGQGDGLPAGPVTAIAANTKGELWVSTLTEGVAYSDGTEWRAVPAGGETMFNRVVRFLPDRDGSMWLASPLDGAIHTDGLAWVRYTLRSGLPGSQV